MSEARPPPEGASTLTGVIGEFAALGFVGEFVVRPHGVLVCDHCGQPFAADTADVQGERRLEGVSDPADMQIVLALVCPNCSRRGTVAVAYGPVSDEDSQDVLRDVTLST